MRREDVAMAARRSSEKGEADVHQLLLGVLERIEVLRDAGFLL